MNQLAAYPPVVSMHNVSKAYVSHGNAYTALVNIDLAVSRGQLSLILGPSGSGKTTLLAIAAGFVAATSGRVRLFGRSLDGYSASELQLLRARNIAFIFQTFLLIDALTVAENIELQLHFAGLVKQEARSRTRAALVRVGIPHLAGKRPFELSHGERQRVTIARAVASDAELLIADEPTASLDTQQSADIISLLHTCAADLNKCVLIASHDRRLCEYADVTHILDDGCFIDTSQLIHAGTSVLD